MKKWLLAGSLLLWAFPVHATQRIKEYTIWSSAGTAAADTVTQQSMWIPIRGAKAVYIRLRSSGQGAWTGADSAYVDSVNTVTFCFSDSLNPSLTGFANKMAADSICQTGAINTPVAVAGKLVGFFNTFEGTVALRPAVTGSGRYAVIFPYQGNADGGVQPLAANATIVMPAFMKVTFIPYRRNTLSGAVSTEGNRTRGLRNARMRAFVIYDN